MCNYYFILRCVINLFNMHQILHCKMWNRVFLITSHCLNITKLSVPSVATGQIIAMIFFIYDFIYLFLKLFMYYLRYVDKNKNYLYLLWNSTRKKRRGMLATDVLFLQNNTIVMKTIHYVGLELLEHPPPYSPDISYLFLQLIKSLKVRKYSSNEEVAEVIEWRCKFGVIRCYIKRRLLDPDPGIILNIRESHDGYVEPCNIEATM